MPTPLADAITLRISEIFFSLQGETSRAGLPTVFIRLTGCPLRCTWCDTEHAFSGGEIKTLQEIMAALTPYQTPFICVTGGEPLAQKNCHYLLSSLCDAGYSVSLETSGSMDISKVDGRVSRIVDLKPPSSGEETKNLWANLAYLTPNDEIKIVIASQTDYEWAKEKIETHALATICPLLLSPVSDLLAPNQLAEWMLSDQLPARFQLQLHKQLWGNTQGR